VSYRFFGATPWNAWSANVSQFFRAVADGGFVPFALSAFAALTAASVGCPVAGLYPYTSAYRRFVAVAACFARSLNDAADWSRRVAPCWIRARVAACWNPAVFTFNPSACASRSSACCFASAAARFDCRSISSFGACAPIWLRSSRIRCTFVLPSYASCCNARIPPAAATAGSCRAYADCAAPTFASVSPGRNPCVPASSAAPPWNVLRFWSVTCCSCAAGASIAPSIACVLAFGFAAANRSAAAFAIPVVCEIMLL
jgi:hypothetical protein